MLTDGMAHLAGHRNLAVEENAVTYQSSGPNKGRKRGGTNGGGIHNVHIA